MIRRKSQLCNDLWIEEKEDDLCGSKQNEEIDALDLDLSVADWHFSTYFKKMG